jgi:hypothetical protein
MPTSDPNALSTAAIVYLALLILAVIALTIASIWLLARYWIHINTTENPHGLFDIGLERRRRKRLATPAKDERKSTK